MRAHRTVSLILPFLAAAAQVAVAQSTAAKPKRAAAAPAQPPGPPRLTLEPRQPAAATLIRVTIDRLPRNGDTVTAASGEMAGEPLHFVPASNGRLQALGAIPLGASDSVVAHAILTRVSGTTDTLQVAVKFPHQAPPPSATSGSRGRAPGARRLRVDSRFTQRLDTATEARVERENQLARDVGKRAQESPPLWTYPFQRPRDSKVTSRFGTGRVFNGRVSSSHLGVDYRGSVGESIKAANRGVVALVAEFFLAGNVVYIDHGFGLVTGYFHMSETRVAMGDTVERGQEIGLVGATGRVTGPHLHWSARFGAITVDPAALLSLGPPFTQPLPATKRSAETSASSPERR